MQGGQSNSHECRSEQGVPKKVRGDEGNELVQYIGTLVRMADHVSIEYSDWRKVPMQKKDDMYSLVKMSYQA
ncbi:hypothetical protein L1987_55165 [Smallanthus sonchifolius]|uniref:Uncharacterized protein n=1 Tax=Smallanthus sonchifolius TaxID=185202 RepID=A0ACB9E9U8_9ASTR|nr:hypothetical protein L1987_55165 [Smallanthus sonchifolius]